MIENMIALWGVQLFRKALPLITMPYLGRVLGPAGLGLVAFVQGFTVFLGMFIEYGFTLSATRELARSRDLKQRRAELLSGVLGAQLALAIGGLLVSLVAARFVPVLWNQPELLVCGLIFATAEALNPYWYFTGMERLRFVAAIEIGSKLSAACAIFIFVKSPADAWIVLGIQACAAFTAACISLTTALLESGMSRPTPAGVHEALRMGWPMFLFRSADSIYALGNAFVLGLFAPPVLVGYYAGSEKISKAFFGFMNPIRDALFPRLSHLMKDSYEEAAHLARAGIVVMTLGGVFLGAAVYVLAPYVVPIILGPRFAPAIPILRVLALLPPLMAITHSVGFQWLLPIGKNDVLNRIMLSAGLVNFALAALLAPRFAGMGMAWAVVIAEGFLCTRMVLAVASLSESPLSSLSFGKKRETAPPEAIPEPISEEKMHVPKAEVSRLDSGTRALLLQRKRAALAIQKRPVDAVDLPLTGSQQFIWFLHELTGRDPAYNLSFLVSIQGQLDEAAFAAAVRALAERHEILRTTFHGSADGVVQRLDGPLPTLSFISLEHLPASERAAESLRLARHCCAELFDLRRGPLLRGCLMRLSESEHVLALSLHHIACDGWSTRVILQEIAALHRQFLAGAGAPTLPPLPVQYGDYAMWQKRRLDSGVLDAQLAYWKRQLDGAPPSLELPTDFPRPSMQSFKGAKLAFQLPAALKTALMSVAQSEGASLFMILMAAFQVLLHRYTGQSDLIVGTPVAGRSRTELEPLIGMFVNTVLIRGKIDGAAPFGDVLRQIRDTSLDALDHQELPFGRLVEELAPRRDASRPPLAQVFFVLENAADFHVNADGLRLSAREIDNGTAKFELGLSLIEGGPGALDGAFEYNTALFREDTIARMAGHLQIMLEGIAADPSLPVGRLQLLSFTELVQLTQDWNGAVADYPRDATLHELFQQQARVTPGNVAVSFEGRNLTYDELNRASNRLAHRLRELGGDSDVLIAVCLPRCPEQIVAILAVLKAGGAYVAIDPTHPKERNRTILHDSGAPIVITTRQLTSLFAGLPAHMVCLDRDRTLIQSRSDQNPVSSATARNAAYVIYTSGSTGAPKGVLIEHRSVVNHACWHRKYHGVTSSDRVLQFSSLTFDASVEEIFPYLLSGATVVQRPEWVTSSAHAFTDFLRSRSITCVEILPPMFCQEWLAVLAAEGTPLPGSIRMVAMGGDKGSLEVLSLWKKVTGGRIPLTNVYGPTETTIQATVYTLRTQPVPAGVASAPIGWPLTNVRVYVLDRYRNLVPVNVPGELYIGGESLGRGYLRRDELTAEKFIEDPFSTDPGARLYRTGDIVRHLPEGTIEFLGRVDGQVKVRGFRIELGEIEAVLAAHPDVAQAVADVRGEGADKRIVAYVVPRSRACKAAALRDYLSERLPTYMLPATFVLLDRLEINRNGKIDRRALSALALDAEPAASYAAPLTPTERELAEIWSRALGVPQVGRADNFFDLGGHSLKAMQVMSSLRERYGRDFPLSILLRAPTIEQLAALIDHDMTGSASSSVTAVRSGGANPPIFCVHPDPIYPFRFNKLAARLGQEQPVYGIQPVSLDGGRIRSIAEIAASSIEEMRSVQQSGPYTLLGFCMGGIVAFEMAQQLREMGDEVRLLALIDSVSPRYRLDAFELKTRLRYHLRIWHSQGAVDYARERVSFAKTKLWRHLWRLGHAATVKRGKTLPAFLRDATEAFIKSGLEYKPRPYPGALAIFRAEIHPLNSLDPELGWSGFANELQAIEIPGDHVQLLAEPNVSVLAEHLKLMLTGEAAPAAASH